MAYSKAQKRYITIARARKRLEQRLEMMDWEEEVLAPAIQTIAELEQTETVEIEAGDDLENLK